MPGPFNTYLLCITLLTAFSSCFTSSNIDRAKLDRKPQEINFVKDAYLDTSGAQLIVNFNARLSKTERKMPLHVIIPLDTILALYERSYKLTYQPTDSIQRLYHLVEIDRLGKHSNNLECCGTVISHDRSVLQNGYFSDSSVTPLPGRIILPDSKYDFSYPYKNGRLHAKHMALIYIPDGKIGGRYRTDYVVLNMEPSGRKKYARYSLLPLTAVADLVTGPFQLIGYGTMALIAYTMKF